MTPLWFSKVKSRFTYEFWFRDTTKMKFILAAFSVAILLQSFYVTVKEHYFKFKFWHSTKELQITMTIFTEYIWQSIWRQQNKTGGMLCWSNPLYIDWNQILVILGEGAQALFRFQMWTHIVCVRFHSCFAFHENL